MTEKQEKIVEQTLILLDRSDVMKITGWSKGIVDEMFSYDEEFPAIKKGRKTVIELEALKKYFSTRRYTYKTKESSDEI